MAQKRLLLKNWFHQLNQPLLGPPSASEQVFKYHTSEPSPPNRQLFSLKKNPGKFWAKDFFVPGWTGESLQDRHGENIAKILANLHKDALKKFEHTEQFNRSLRSAIFDEFLAYSDHQAISFPEIEDSAHFWSVLTSQEASLSPEIQNFVELYCLRVASLYFYKLRFVYYLGEKSGDRPRANELANLNSYLMRMFKKGGTSELASMALEANLYSWYRPSSEAVQSLQQNFFSFGELGPGQISKHLSKKFQDYNVSSQFSHTLSHQSFGLFLNSLNRHMIPWLKKQRTSQQRRPSGNLKESTTRSLLLTGDYLNSLAIGFWTGQEKSSLAEDYSQFFCSDVAGQEYDNNLFLRLICEYQLLTFLSRKSAGTKVENLCQIYNQHLQRKSSHGPAQTTLFAQEPIPKNDKYDIIYLNLSHFPRNNAHHHLLQSILRQKQCLRSDGYLVVFSAQNFFIPSQKEKIEHLLKDFQLEAYVNFDGLKGRGELGPHLYFFSEKRPIHHLSNHELNSGSPCLSFRFSGTLETFYHFEGVHQILKEFTESYQNSVPSFYQKGLGDRIKLEFYQDAIVDGRLIKSLENQKEFIAHPNFFKNLMESSLPLDFFFELIALGPKSKGSDKKDDSQSVELPYLQASVWKNYRDFSFILVLDKRIENGPKLEIIEAETYEGVSYEYGHSRCLYFGLAPKFGGLDINLFRDYLSSDIGKQMSSFVFSHSQTKLKSKVCSFLIPKFLAQTEKPGEDVLKVLSLMAISQTDFCKMGPKELISLIRPIEHMRVQLCQQFPLTFMEHLSLFKARLIDSLQYFTYFNQKKQIDFQSPQIKEKLLLSLTAPLYPNNKEIHIEFLIKNPKEIFCPLSHVVAQDMESKDSAALTLFSGEKPIVQLFGPPMSMQFLKFLLEGLIEQHIGELLQGIQVPSAEKLTLLIQEQKITQDALLQLAGSIEKLINQILAQQILHSRKS